MPVLAQCAREGATVRVVVVTAGELGVTDHAALPAGDTLAAVRAEEARCASAALGIEPPVLLGYPDGGLAGDWGHMWRLARDLDSLFHHYNPDFILTWGPDGGTGHPDHRTVSDVVTEVYQRDSIHAARTLLYTSVPLADFHATPAMRSPYARELKEGFKTTQSRFLTYRIGYDARSAARAATAIRCYASQFSPDGMRDITALTLRRDSTVYFRPYFGSEVRRTLVD